MSGFTVRSSNADKFRDWLGSLRLLPGELIPVIAIDTGNAPVGASNFSIKLMSRSMSEELRRRRRANFKTLLKPRHVAFIGGRHLERCIAMCRASGYSGALWVVNPKYESIAGIRCAPSIDALPEAPDASFIALSAERAVAAVRSLAEVGAAGAVCHASGFAELGAQHALLQATLQKAAGELAVLGPNCMGFINGFDKVALWGDHGYFSPVEGSGVALISQSGAFLFGVTNVERAYPLGYGISTGNQAVIDIANLIEIVIDDPRVRVVGLYVEGLIDGRRFGTALAKALKKKIPVVLLRGGGTQAAAQRSLSHTGTLAVPNDFWEALSARYAIVEVDSPKQLVETTKLLAVSGVLSGPKVFFTTYSGAACTLLAEQAPANGLELPLVTDTNYQKIRPTLPDVVTISNPFDLALPWQSDALVKMDDAQSITQCLLDATCGSVDAIVFMLDIPRAGDERDTIWLPAVEAMIEVAEKTGLPCVVASLLPEGLEPSVREHALRNGVAPLMGLSECVRALAGSVKYAADSRVARHGMEAIPDLAAGESPCSPAPLDEWHSREALKPYGVVFPNAWSGGWEEAVPAADNIGYPVVVKALSRHIPHKRQAGGVRLSLYDGSAVRMAIHGIRDDVFRRVPGLIIDKFLVEEMIRDVEMELIIGIKRHPTLGTALLIGRGGTAVETLGSYVLVLLPATQRELNFAISNLNLTLAPGVRGRLMAMVRAVEAYALANPNTLSELDLNPVVVGQNGTVTAVDALIISGVDSANESPV